MTEGGREAEIVTDLTEEHINLIKTEKMVAFMYVCVCVCVCMHTCKCVRARHY